MKEMRQGTKLTVNWEVEEQIVTSALKGISEMVDIPKMVAEVMEMGIARAQVYFDPSLKVKELLEKGIRGDFYDVFYQANQFSIWINVAPDKLAKLLTNSKTWETWKEKYNVDFGQCWVKKNLGPCPIQFNFPLIKLEANSFAGTYEYPEYIFSWWVFQRFKFNSRLQTFIKPESGGTRVIFDLALEPVAITPAFPELANLLMAAGEMEKTLEQILIDLKTQMEKIG